MKSSEEFRVAIAAARLHAQNLRADIRNASNRSEHIRLLALTLEAENVVHILEIMDARPELDRNPASA